jgi:hypothetical protein
MFVSTDNNGEFNVCVAGWLSHLFCKAGFACKSMIESIFAAGVYLGAPEFESNQVLLLCVVILTFVLFVYYGTWKAPLSVTAITTKAAVTTDVVVSTNSQPTTTITNQIHDPIIDNSTGTLNDPTITGEAVSSSSLPPPPTTTNDHDMNGH